MSNSKRTTCPICKKQGFQDDYILYCRNMSCAYYGKDINKPLPEPSFKEKVLKYLEDEINELNIVTADSMEGDDSHAIGELYALEKLQHKIHTNDIGE